jgi:small subunit ribosomal protein S2
MKNLPGALFVVDTKKEDIAMKEAAVLKIPTVALLDTNCDPDLITHPIPGNDDAIRSIKLMADLAADAVLEGRAIYEKTLADAKAEEAARLERVEQAALDEEKILARAEAEAELADTFDAEKDEKKIK